MENTAENAQWIEHNQRIVFLLLVDDHGFFPPEFGELNWRDHQTQVMSAMFDYS